MATDDGGCIAGGLALSGSGDIDCSVGYIYWIIRLDADGNIVWQECFPIETSEAFSIMKIASTQDGEFICALQARSLTFNSAGYNFDYVVIKINSEGVVQWQKYFGGSADDHVADVVQLPNKHYVLTGTSSSADYDVTTHNTGVNSDVWTIELDENGNLLHNNSLYSIDYDYGTCLDVSSDGGILVGGWVSTYNTYDTSYEGVYDLLIAKFGPEVIAPGIYFADADGDYYGNPSSSITSCSVPLGYVNNNSDCNDANPFIHPGATEFLNGKDDNCNGTIDENGVCPVPYNTQSLLIGATSAELSWNDIITPSKFIVNYKVSSASSWTKVTLDGSVKTLTLSNLSPNTTYKWRVKGKCNGVYSDFTSIQTFATLMRSSAVQESNSEIDLFPNPADNNLWIDFHSQTITAITIFNDLEQKVLEENCDVNSSSALEVNISSLHSGIYFMQLRDSEGSIVVKKFVKQ